MIYHLRGEASRKLFNLLASGLLTPGNFPSFCSEAERYLRSYSQGDNCVVFFWESMIFFAMQSAMAPLDTGLIYSLLLLTYFSR